MKKISFFSFLLTILFACQTSSQTQEIIENRKLSNAAIKAHQIKGVTKHLTEDVAIIAASGQLVHGRDALASYLEVLFEQNEDIYFVRTTNQITLNANKDMAWEQGRWSGHRPATKDWKVIKGNYTAVWIKEDKVWKMRSQQFMQLH